MRVLKITGLAVAVLLVIIQFFPAAPVLPGDISPAADISHTVVVPGPVRDIFKRSCYDCHSNQTRYPWYTRIQPVGWLMASHIRKGRDNLDLSSFGTYSKRKQWNKLRSIAESIRDSSMPLTSYLWMHPDARLSSRNAMLVFNWAEATRNTMGAAGRP